MEKSRINLKMSSYGAIGVEEDLDPLLDEVPIRAPGRPISRTRAFSASSLGRASPSRQPYLFSGGIGLREESLLSLHSEDDLHREHNNALRYRLYNRLDPGGETLVMPNHVFPSGLFSILPFEELKDNSGKQGSIVTIFSIWNTMMGTSLLAMPWALQQAGLVGGIVIMLALAGLCFYTAYIVIESPKRMHLSAADIQTAEFSDVCREYLGKTGEMLAVVFSIIVLIGGVIVYWVLMSNFLYYTGAVVYEALQPNSTTIPVMENKTFTCDVYCPEEAMWTKPPKDPFFDQDEWNFDKFWTLQGTVPIYLAFALFPLMNFKSPTFFTKFNVLGTVSVMYLLIFVFSKLLECGVNMDFNNPKSIHYVQLFNWHFPALSGTLTLSYFIHNAVLTILRNQKKPENNARDLSIGYSLVAFCYVFIGFTFFAAFPVQRSCISDNFLNNFGAGDVLSSTARLFLLFQMITVLPLLMFLVRSQLFYAISKNTWPGILKVILLNVLLIAIAVLFASFYPNVGSILRYVGSISGLIYVFALPSLVYIRQNQALGTLTPFKKYAHYAIILKEMTRVMPSMRKLSTYVDRVKLLDYWTVQDSSLQNEFPRSTLVLMVDRQLLVSKGKSVTMIEYSYTDLKKKLGEYGVDFDISKSCLLDAIPGEIDMTPLFGVATKTATLPEDSPISKTQVLKQLADSFGGRFIDIRTAMLTMDQERQRHLLAKFQVLTKWSSTYRRCPKCAAALKMRVSKSGAECLQCEKTYYPTFSPVTITIVTDPTFENILLARHKNSPGGVFTAIAGFAQPGENLVDCVRREVAEEIGIEVNDVKSLNMSQPWPMPDSSLMIAHIAIADMNQSIDICPEEIQTAKWFTREEVRAALETTLADPFLKNLSKVQNDPDALHYIPPTGAIAHHMIADWVLNKPSKL
ncbi:unnamed protein product [Caenorhabditis angaria]|uniref:NAD(+) diphosphatase n=1 Tax=Caenorhabditis angaria TaxID=860376 RepID=A0A9P1N4B5_9PELO|nr:unnamed protein product [Caenorhabditis angaria]